MNKDTAKVLKNSLFYSIGGVLSKGIGFIMLPIYTAFLTPDQYGVVNLITSFASVMIFLLELSLDAAVIRFYAEFKEDISKCKLFFGTIVIFVAINSILIMGLMIILGDMIGSLIFSKIAFYPYIFTGYLSLLFMPVYSIYQNILKAKQQGKEYIKNSIGYLFIHTILNVVLVVVFKMGAEGMLLSLLITNLLFMAFSIFDMLRKDIMVFRVDFKLLKLALKYSIPILPHNLSNYISIFSSKFFLGTTKMASVGLYTVATQFSSIIDLVQSSINLSFRPWFNEQMKNGEEGKRNIAKFAESIFSLSCFVCIGVALFSQEVVYIMVDTKYHTAWQVVPILAASAAIKFVYYTHILVLMYSIKGSRFAFICSFSGSFANLITGYFLIPRLDMFGAATALLVSNILRSVVTVFLSNKFDSIGYNMIKILSRVVIIVIMSALGLFMSYYFEINTFNILNVLYKIVILALATLLLFRGQWKAIKETIGTITSRIARKRECENLE